MTSPSRVAWTANVQGETSRQRDVAARFRLRAEASADTPPVPGGAAQTCPAQAGAGSDYTISCVTGAAELAHWTGEWRLLLAGSQSPEKIYQTPEFFRFLADSHTTGSDQFELFVVRHRVQDKVVGFVPVRVSGVPLDFSLGRVCLYAFQPQVVRILGSVPLMPLEPALLQQLFDHLLAAFPACAAVSMQAFPQEMQALLAHDRRHRPFIVHGWRDCHTIPLPEDVPAYMAKMSAKKRYNLARQYRLLEQATGPLVLERIDRSVNVKTLMAGVAALSQSAAHAPTGARDYRVLAANRLLLSYVLRRGEDVVAVIAGSRYGDTWHVHQILYAPAYRHLSLGTVALHTALQDVIAHFAFTTADLGYGCPRDRFASTHVLKTRAHVLVARRGGCAALLLAAFVRFDGLRAACAQKIKSLARRLFGK